MRIGTVKGSENKELVMKKNIWIINQDASTPATAFGGRSYYLAEELAALGHDVYLIASAAHHHFHTKPEVVDDFQIERIAGFNFVWVKMPDYEHAHSKKRVLNWFLFPWRIQKLARKITAKPDVILCSSPPPIAFLGAQRLAKKFNAKLVFEVRDIWPLTLVEVGGYSPKHPFIRFMQWVEKRAYRDSDAVVSNLKNAVEHMVSLGLDRNRFSWIPNGFSMREVSQGVPLNSVAADSLPKDKFIVGYAGTLGVANTLDSFIEAAARLKDYSEIVFVLVGRGKEKQALQALVAEKQLGNVVFVDPVPKVEIQAVLSRFDVCYIGWLSGDLYRFGIGANKIPEYLFSGKPVLHAYAGACDPIKECGAGLCIKPQDPQLLADSVLRLYAMSPEERQQMGEKGRKSAIEQFEYGILAQKLEQIFFDH